ncbi:MAG: cell division protein ZapB [SAR324 cluster bacterium]|nr:cell division protein ZapB [SAR324 cluster bacterium]MEC8222733.1 cell division protein ZapB [SAR324 cluster bacterium]
MYNELLNQLEKRIQEAVETIEMYRLEIAELKEKNSELENQHQVWEDKLSSLIQKFETLNQSEDSESVESEDTSTSDSSYSYGSASESESEEESQDDSETSSYSSTTSFGSQAVASSYHYSNQDE